MSKLQIQKFIENDELDLSLQNLTDIPAKEISKYPKIRSVDLSCNALENITSNIGLLTSITRLDLSKNKIHSLPEDFGKLTNLTYLDLRSNKLTNLPASLCNLKKLKWLDLKDNPLNESLSKAAGDCLDKDKCEKCAVNVVELLNQTMTKTIKKNQKKKRREEEILRQIAEGEDKQREQNKIEKTKLRMKRKLELEQERQQTLVENLQENRNTSNYAESMAVNNEIGNLKSNKLINCFYQLLICLFCVVVLTAIVLFLLVLCDNNSHLLPSNVVLLCRRIDSHLPNSVIYFRKLVKKFVNSFN